MKPSGLHTALCLLPLGIGLAAAPVQAQITPETGNPTNTTININGTTIDIKDGTTGGTNLFHSFDQFNINSGETVNFQTTPTIQNILGRVVGGDPSLINGLIQVTGGNANLFLMNPAGIVFGANAQLNVMGSFTATTANGIGLGSNWFNAIGNNDYTNLTGTPNQFAFTMSQPGTIINSGNLSVLEGKNLNLFGGTVISTGSLTAPGGQINIASVDGGNVLRLSQTGMLLSLDIIPTSAAGSLPNDLTFSPLDLPGLLTGGAATNATGVQKNADGTVNLTGSGYKIENGDLVATNATTTSGIAGGGIHLLSGGFLNAGTLNTTGSNVTLETKGDITLGGINTGGGSLAGGNITVTTTEGKIEITGSLDSNSTVDAGDIIIDANGDITATGLISGYSASGTAADITINSTNGSIQLADVGASTDSGNGGNIEIQSFNNLITGRIDSGASSQGDAGNITLDAGGNIETSGVYAITHSGNGGIININAGGDFQKSSSFTGNTQLSAVSYRNGDSGSITVNAGGNINAGGISASAPDIFNGGNAGDISLTSGGNFTADSITSISAMGNGGSISLKVLGDIQIKEVISAAVQGNAGDVTIEVGGGITITNGALENFLLGNCGTSAAGTVDCNADGSVTLTPSFNFSFFKLLGGPVKITPIASSSSSSGTTTTSGSSSSGTTTTSGSGSSGTTTTSGSGSSGTTTTSGSDTTAASGNSSQTGTTPSSGSSGTQITVTTTDGREESVTNPTVVASTVEGDAGETSINATDDVNTGSIDSRSGLEGNGKNISVSSSEGGVKTEDLNSSAQQGNAGNIGVSGNNDVTVGNVDASTNYSPPPTTTAPAQPAATTPAPAPATTAPAPAPAATAPAPAPAATTPAPATSSSPALPATALGTSGSITITSNKGDVTTGDVSTTANVGTGGPVNLEGAGNVTAEDISTNVNSGNAGDVTATSTGGGITTGDINTSSASNGSGGGVTATAPGDINLGNINTSAGPTTPTTTSPATATATASPVIAPANISPSSVTAAPVVNNPTPTATVVAPAPTSGPEPTPLNAAGNVTITSTAGEVNLGDVNGSAIDGPAGNVQINANQNITTGDITSRSENQQAGIISLNSDVGRIVTGALDANSGSGFPDGQITLQAPQGITIGPVLSDNILIIEPSVKLSLGLQQYQRPYNQPTVNQTSTPNAAPDFPGTVAPAPATPPTEQPLNQGNGVSPNAGDSSNPTTEPVSLGRDNPKNPRFLAPPQSPNLNPASNLPTSPPANGESLFDLIDQQRTNEYTEYLRNKELPKTKSETQMREMLTKISRETSLKPAIIYVDDQKGIGMRLVMLTGSGRPTSVYPLTEHRIQRRINSEGELVEEIVTTNKIDDLKEMVKLFHNSVRDQNTAKTSVVHDAQLLYNILIKPLEAELQSLGINTLIFGLPDSMSLLPIAALHDGQQFLVEKYKVAQIISSSSFSDASYNGLQDGQVLAMGISDFKRLANVKELENLLGVNETLDAINSSWPNGVAIYRNEQATLANLAEARQSQRFNMVHISTHAAFQNKDNNYIQFWDGQKHLEDLRQVQWYGDRSVELLVLSACETAVGNRDAEMGFAGLSVQAGVKTAIATLWKVSDGGTSELMAQLYQNLGQFPTKVEALQQAQIAMLRGEVKPKQADLDFTHPYYWAPFTLIGTPW